MKSPSVSIRHKKSLLEPFKRLAKASLEEVFGFAFGRAYDGAIYELEEIWIPENWRDFATNCSVEPPDVWFEEAKKLAKRINLQVIGTIHSHPLDNHKNPQFQQACPSEMDWDHHIYYPLEGICAISRNKNDIISARVRWWPQVPPVRVKIC